MFTFDTHALSFVMRWLHVAAMTFMVGGAGLLVVSARRVTEDGGALLRLATVYEAVFWIVLGVQVISGIGNLGAFGTGLPLPQTVWGGQFIVKLGRVLILMLFSLLRTMLVLMVGNQEPLPGAAALSRVTVSAYGGTLLVLLMVLVLAEGLAHG